MTQPLLEQDRFLTMEEVADYLNMDIQHLRKWARDGKLPAVKFSYRTWRIHTSDLKQFIDRHKETEG